MKIKRGDGKMPTSKASPQQLYQKYSSGPGPSQKPTQHASPENSDNEVDDKDICTVGSILKLHYATRGETFIAQKHVTISNNNAVVGNECSDKESQMQEF